MLLPNSGGVQIHQKEGYTERSGKKICLPKEEGGIGFRMIHEFNLTLLAKQLWRLVQFLDSLVARVLSGRYYRLSSPLRVNTACSPSYVWTSISAARKLLLLGSDKKYILAMKSRCGRIHGFQRPLRDQPLP